MNLVLWVLQVLLAVAFLAHGWLLLFPPASLVADINATFNPAFRVFLGVAEVLAAVGLILPGVTRIMPRLVAWAALGIVVVMISATIFHIMRSEFSSAATTAVLLLMAGFVAAKRWR